MSKYLTLTRKRSYILISASVTFSLFSYCPCWPFEKREQLGLVIVHAPRPRATIPLVEGFIEIIVYAPGNVGDV